VLARIKPSGVAAHIAERLGTGADHFGAPGETEQSIWICPSGPPKPNLLRLRLSRGRHYLRAHVSRLFWLSKSSKFSSVSFC